MQTVYDRLHFMPLKWQCMLIISQNAIKKVSFASLSNYFRKLAVTNNEALASTLKQDT